MPLFRHGIDPTSELLAKSTPRLSNHSRRSKHKGSAPIENIPLLKLGQDEKMEQKLVFEICNRFCPRLNLYDINMRKFIAAKYGVQIPSLTQKWSELCWFCFTKTELKKCVKCSCSVAQYCGKNCQRGDWKIHKVLHDDDEVLKDCFRKLWFMSDPIIRNTKRKIRCSKCDKVGHTIRSCPEIRDSEKSEDDYFFDSLIFHDNDPFDYEAEDWGDDWEDIWEDEKGDNEMEVVEDDDDYSYLDDLN